MNVIPAIDVRDGYCVRLLQGDFAKEKRYSDDPSRVAADFQGLGFRQLHVVDLDGARSGNQANRDAILEIAAGSDLTIQLGGGIRDRETISAWLDAGVSRCVIGSIAVTEPERVRDWLAAFGPERIVLALDVALDDGGTPWLSTHGWTRMADTTLWDCVDAYSDSGLVHVLCTDVRRDGALTGPNLDLYADFLRRHPELRLQASGGVRDVADLASLRGTGTHAAITGRALLDGRITREELATFLPGA